MALHQEGADEVTNLLVDLPETGPMRESIHAIMKVRISCGPKTPNPEASKP